VAREGSAALAAELFGGWSSHLGSPLAQAWQYRRW
jgi:hypothetical protein